jgi:membrane-associated phospholipid phosphatase
MERAIWPPAIGAAYITTHAVLGGLHAGHILIGALSLLDLYNPRTRQFLRTFLPCIIAGALYDSFRYFLAPVITGRIHVAGPYLFERAWLSFNGHTLNEIFARHHWVAADVIAGLTYLGYVLEYLALTLLLFAQRHVVRAHTFARGFLVVNVMGFATYLLYPAAPPWYVTAHGLGAAEVAAAPSSGGAARFDALFHTHVFSRVYGHSVEVFGALPSLHAAYPTLAAVLVFATPALRWARWPAVTFAMLMAWSAIYLQHHYVIDVLLGWIYVAITAVIVLAWERRAP